MLERIEAATAHALRCKALPVILGGEHTVTLGALRALAAEAARTGEPFGVVQFDAHADLRSQYEGSIYSHASVMHRAVADLGLPLAQFAMRDFCREEVDVRRRYNVLHYDADILFRQGLPERPLPEDFPRRLYITFDVDGLDASLMPATGTPSPGGLFWHQALLLIERCLKGRSMAGMDVVELAPLPGLHHADFTAAKLTHALMGFAQRAGLPLQGITAGAPLGGKGPRNVAVDARSFLRRNGHSSGRHPVASLLAMPVASCVATGTPSGSPSGRISAGDACSFLRRNGHSLRVAIRSHLCRRCP